MPSALEARHWGATYALHRVSVICIYLYAIILRHRQFCNGIQLNRVLPPGPRDYWNQLAAEQKAAPEHQSWMYDADPFAARKMVQDRQEKATKKKEEASRPESGIKPTSHSPEYANAPEAKMATSLRDFVEDAVKQVIIYTTLPSWDEINVWFRDSLSSRTLLIWNQAKINYLLQTNLTSLRSCSSSDSLQPKCGMLLRRYPNHLPLRPAYSVVFRHFKLA